MRARKPTTRLRDTEASVVLFYYAPHNNRATRLALPILCFSPLQRNLIGGPQLQLSNSVSPANVPSARTQSQCPVYLLTALLRASLCCTEPTFIYIYSLLHSSYIIAVARATGARIYPARVPRMLIAQLLFVLRNM